MTIQAGYIYDYSRRKVIPGSGRDLLLFPRGKDEVLDSEQEMRGKHMICLCCVRITKIERGQLAPQAQRRY